MFKYCAYCTQFVDEEFFMDDRCEDCYYDQHHGEVEDEEYEEPSDV